MNLCACMTAVYFAECVQQRLYCVVYLFKIIFMLRFYMLQS